MQFSLKTRSIALAAVASLTLTMGAVGSPLVLAQDAIPMEALINPDPNATGSLIIHKKADPTTTGTPTGELTGGVSGTDLDGVGFTVYKVNGANLTTNEGLAAAATLRAADLLTADGDADTAKVTIQGTEQLTANGQANFAGLPLGVYLVVETSPLEGYIPATPFLAFVPMTMNNADTGGVEWNYNVHAYPKNYKTQQPTKTVQDSGVNQSQQLTYTVTAYAQPVGEGQTRTTFRIEDTLDEKLTPAEATNITVNIAGTVTFTRDTDYTVTVTGQQVVVTFQGDGLTKLGNNAAVEVTIPATVNEKVNTDPNNGIIPNKAQVIENAPGSTQEATPKETPEVKTYYGGVSFSKVAAGTIPTPLPGAEFRVLGTTAARTCSQAVEAAMDDSWMSTAGATNGIWTSGADGKVEITGLHVNDYANNAEGDNLYTKYCLVETKSPEGYELLAQPIEFQVLKAEVDAGTAIKQLTADGLVRNLPDTTPKLPLTGGAGVGLLATLGAIIVALGAWFARRSTASK